jgi:hydrogenase 3 maturation protease
MKQLLFTVGNEMMGDDGAGPLLAQLLRRSPVSGWSVLDGGPVPENSLHLVRDLQPELILVVDAAEMGLATGSIRHLSEDDIVDQLLMTTHNLPLTFLINALKEIAPEVRFLGIQPSVIAFSYPVSSGVQNAVAEIHERLQSGHLDYPGFSTSA